MSKWLVELRGSVDALRKLVDLSSPPDWSVTEENGQFYLASSDLEALEEATEARTYAAYWLLPVINGAVGIVSGRGRSWAVDIGSGVVLQGEGDNSAKQRFIFIEEEIYLYAESDMIVTGEGGTVASTPAPPTVMAICTAMRRDPTVVDALCFFSMRDYWAFTLFKVFEIVRKEAGGKEGIIDRGWATKEQIDGFMVIHDPELLGRYARHGVQTDRSAKRSPSNPMLAESDARRFIRSLLEQWLRWKYQECRAGGHVTSAFEHDTTLPVDPNEERATITSK